MVGNHKDRVIDQRPGFRRSFSGFQFLRQIKYRAVPSIQIRSALIGFFHVHSGIQCCLHLSTLKANESFFTEAFRESFGTPLKVLGHVYPPGTTHTFIVFHYLFQCARRDCAKRLRSDSCYRFLISSAEKMPMCEGRLLPMKKFEMHGRAGCGLSKNQAVKCLTWLHVYRSQPTKDSWRHGSFALFDFPEGWKFINKLFDSYAVVVDRSSRGDLDIRTMQRLGCNAVPTGPGLHRMSLALSNFHNARQTRSSRLKSSYQTEPW